ncbi:ABC transporter substrate-binding protein [Deinococcus petrolearius]|uniref:ABC transporter substrate-binding protein n=1 Tax=Deinococcus petrolearius TaxID=1751295 RepID=A0ABW1DQ03_9DEIO
MIAVRRLARLALPLLCLTLGAAEARTYAQIRDIGVLRVGMPGDLPPFSIGAGKSMVGFEAELVQEVARSLNLRVIFEQIGGDDLLAALDQDRIDVATNNLVITSTRETRFDFSAPYNCSGVSIVSLSKSLNKNADLVGKKIGVPRNTIIQTYVEKLAFDKTVKVYETSIELIRGVATGDVDATYAFSAMAPTIQRLYPQLGVHFSPALWSAPNGMALRSGNEALRQAVNGALTRYMRTPAYKALLTKHFAQDTSCKS